jgi:Na+/H+ antiporter NhaD/arsenite permease-like protein
MYLAWLSFGALILSIIVSCVTELNVGVLALTLAWIVGVYIGGLGLGEVLQGFPVQLFLTLTGVTLLFAQAQHNGTLDKVAHRAIGACRGNVGLIPIMFFLLGAALASIGPGNISTTALLAPIAMPIAAQAGVPAFLMAIMVGNGANAGSLSPFAPTGIIVNGSMARIGLAGYEWPTYFNNLVAHMVVAFTGYLLLGGWRLFRTSYSGAAAAGTEAAPFDRRHGFTLAVIGALLVAVIFFGVNVGMGAFAGAVLLAATGVADHKEAIKRMPWNVIVMVSGVTVLIALLERFQGLDLFTSFLARFATADTVTGVVGFLTAFISVYSSTSGVVLPAFLPTIPGLIERLGGGDPVAIASSMNVSSHLVDVSPLSTIGALCLAAVPASENVRSVFNKLMGWGLSMTVVGALASYLLF